MASQDSASQPRAGRHLRVVRSDDGTRAGEIPASEPRPPCRLTACPDCRSDLAVLRIIPGRAADYWTMRCTRCGGIHLDVVEASEVVRDSGNLSA